MYKNLILIGIFSLSLPGFAGVPYWSSSDSCNGNASGVLFGDSKGCFAAGGGGRVWSVKVGGTCIDVDDFSCNTKKSQKINVSE